MDLALYGALIVFISNIILLIVHLLQIYKVRKEIKDVKIVINNTTELKHALSKPLEGIWQVSGKFPLYHNIYKEYFSSGFAYFIWNDSYKKYDIYYTYSVRGTQEPYDLVTAICQGTVNCKNNGNLYKDDNLKLDMNILHRTSADKITNCSSDFELISKKIIKQDEKILEIIFQFSNNNSLGEIKFKR